jgi:hypothetical protein
MLPPHDLLPPLACCLSCIAFYNRQRARCKFRSKARSGPTGCTSRGLRTRARRRRKRLSLTATRASPLIVKEGAQVGLSTLAHAIVKRTMRTSPASVPPPSSAPKKTRGTAAVCASSVARKPWASKVRGSGAGQENISRKCVLRDAGLQVEERRTGLVEKARKRRLVANR